MKIQDLKPGDIERERLNWFSHDAKRFTKDDSFIFKLETIGVYTNLELIQKACDIIIEKLDNIQKVAAQLSLEIITSKNTLPNCFDIIIKNEDYTIGKILEYILHEDYFKTNKKLNYVGFIREHPHDDDSILRISFVNENASKDEISTMMEYVCRVAIKIFNHIRDL